MQLDATKRQRIEGRLAIFLDAGNALTWCLKADKELKGSIDIQKAQYKVRKQGHYQYFNLFHNLPARSFSLMESLVFHSWKTELSCSGPRVTQALTLCIKAGLAEWGPLQFPVGKEEQHAWVLECLLHSKDRGRSPETLNHSGMRKGSGALVACPEVL